MLVKTVVNNDGGTATEADFQASIDGFTADWSTSVELMAGTHTASEVELFGYAASDWGGDCAADGTVSLLVGENKECTITNDDIRPELTVIKHVINDDGRTAEASDFTMLVDATNPDAASFPGAEAPGTTIGLDAGSHSVTEDMNEWFDLYTVTYSADCSGTIGVGETKTCIVTNNDRPQIGQITPTGTTCQNYVEGADTLGEVYYGFKKDGFINNVAPGVFFYYLGPITVDDTSTPLVVTQDNLLSWDPIALHGAPKLKQAVLYDESCNKLGYADEYSAGTVTFNNPSLGNTYYIGIKYGPGSIVGEDVGSGPTYPTDIYEFYLVGDLSTRTTLNVEAK